MVKWYLVNAITKIALVIFSVLAVFVGVGISAYGAQTKPVMLEIIDGETAFIVDEQAQKAWWVVGECRRPLPVETSSKTSKNQRKSIASKMISKDVRIGSRHVKLQQQFRFNMASTPASVDVYNSVRGGWSSVPVRVNMACMTDAACRSRMELPEC